MKADTPCVDFVLPVILSVGSHAPAVKQPAHLFCDLRSFTEATCQVLFEILQTKLLFATDFNDLVFCQDVLHALEKTRAFSHPLSQLLRTARNSE